MLSLLLDSMTVRRVSWTSRVPQGCPTGSRGLSGVSGGVMEGVQVLKGVKNGVRGFLGIERSLGDPRGSRGVRGVVKVSQG